MINTHAAFATGYTYYAQIVLFNIFVQYNLSTIEIDIEFILLKIKFLYDRAWGNMIKKSQITWRQINYKQIKNNHCVLFPMAQKKLKQSFFYQGSKIYYLIEFITNRIENLSRSI